MLALLNERIIHVQPLLMKAEIRGEHSEPFKA